MNFPQYFSRNRKFQIVIPIGASFLISIFIYLLLRPESILVLRPQLGFLLDLIETILISLIAIAPLIYGWFTKRPWESALFGILLNVFLSIPGFLAAVHFPGKMGFLEPIAFGGALALTSAGAGYLAARGDIRYYTGALLFVLLWVFVFLSGLN